MILNGKFMIFGYLVKHNKAVSGKTLQQTVC